MWSKFYLLNFKKPSPVKDAIGISRERKFFCDEVKRFYRRHLSFSSLFPLSSLLFLVVSFYHFLPSTAYLVQYQYFHRRCAFRTSPVNSRLIKIAISWPPHFSPFTSVYVWGYFFILAHYHPRWIPLFLSLPLMLSARGFFMVRVSQYIRDDEEGSVGSSVKGGREGCKTFARGTDGRRE